MIELRERPAEIFSWSVLALLLLLLLLGAATLDRSSWPYALVGDEATYLMQAESLAWDFDLLYERQDFDRFREHRQRLPEGLILQSGDQGDTIAYGKPFFYALFAAPFLRFAPANGAAIANALLLALTSVLTARALRGRGGPWTPLGVAVLVFASVSFVYAFWAHADLFLMCLVALAFASITAERPSEPGRRAAARWIFAGLLLAMVGFSRPMYFTLFAPAFFRIPRRDRRRGGLYLAAGAAALLLSAGLVHQALTSSFTGYGAARRGFYSHTGFPEVDFPASEWRENLQEFGNHAVLEPGQIVREKKVDASLLAWSSFYFLFGQHVGVLPYFLPLLLALPHRSPGVRGWSLVAAVVLASAAFFYLRPFNFYGGGGAVGNRYFLPLYPALWFLIERRIRGIGIVGVVLLSGLSMLPMWLSPRAFPLEVDGRYRYAGPLAQCCLPFETTLSHLKVAGREDAIQNGLWMRFLTRNLEPLRDSESLRLEPGRHGRLLLGSYQPLEALDIQMRAPPGSRLEVAEGLLEGRGRRWRLALGRPRAVHPMWWTSKPFYLYRLSFRIEADRPVRLILSPIPPEAVVPPENLKE